MATTFSKNEDSSNQPAEAGNHNNNNNKFLQNFKRMIIGIPQSGFQYTNDQAVDLFNINLQKKFQNDTADIFQVASVLRCNRYNYYQEEDPSSTQEEEVVVPIYRSYIVWRCLWCAFLQLIITPLVAVSLVLSEFVLKEDVNGELNEVHPFCSFEDSVRFRDFVGKLVAFSFSVYIIWSLFVKEQENNNSPKDPANFLILQQNVVPVSVDGLLYIWGYCVNITSQFATAVSASAIIFASGSSIDIMLNSLAIFFINGLDDILATKTEYERAAALMAQGLISQPEVQAETTNLVEENGVAKEKPDIKYRPVRASFKLFKWNGIFSSFVTLILVSCSPFAQLACWRAKADN